MATRSEPPYRPWLRREPPCTRELPGRGALCNAPTMTAARKLHVDDDLVEDGPLYTFDDAPLLDEPDTEERRAAFEAAVEDYRTGRVRMHSGEEVHAELERLRAGAAE